jgi:MraZ protein
MFLYLLSNHKKAKALSAIIGTYECKVDAKGRLLLPAPLKKQLAASLQDGFVLKRSVFQPCLELYPMAEWNLLMAKVNKLNRFIKKNNDFIRRFTAGVKVVEIDNLGRMLIPKDLVAFASIEKDIVLSSGVNIVEIWDKELYEKAIDDATVDFADLAEEVMGNINEDGNGIS